MLSLTAGRVELAAYQRALWGRAAALLPLPDDAPGPCLSNLGLHLPPAASREMYRAASAHAGAHLAYSRERFDARSLKPISRALVGLLEDARVEWLACRELPGLRALWRSFHDDAGPGDAVDFESLMRRLARCLLDPSCGDDHPWVRKGRALFFEDAEGRSLRLRRADDIRLAASRLGHDIGQMRLPFNPRLYAVQPGYRDDHAWLWRDEGTAREHAAPAPSLDGANGGAGKAPTPPVDAAVHRYPEWDRLIGRHRLAWCTVHERLASVAVRAEPDEAFGPQATTPWRLHEASSALQARQWDGERLDLDAAVQACIEQRRGQWPDGRVHVARRHRAQPRAQLCLIDLSASCAPASVDAAGRLAQAAAAELARSQAGASAIEGFRSFGRHAVQVERLKDFDEPLDAEVLGRLRGLRGAGSTRLGAAIRHATRRLLARPEAQRCLLVFTDGEACDIDIHDPHYLVEDARQAVAEARRRGVDVRGCALPGAEAAALRRVFGRAVLRP